MLCQMGCKKYKRCSSRYRWHTSVRMSKIEVLALKAPLRPPEARLPLFHSSNHRHSSLHRCSRGSNTNYLVLASELLFSTLLGTPDTSNNRNTVAIVSHQNNLQCSSYVATTYWSYHVSSDFKSARICWEGYGNANYKHEWQDGREENYPEAKACGMARRVKGRSRPWGFLARVECGHMLLRVEAKPIERPAKASILQHSQAITQPSSDDKGWARRHQSPRR